MNQLANKGSIKWLWAIIPLVVLVALIWVFFQIDPLKPLGVSSPPVEEITVERTILDEEGIKLLVRANGSQPVDIAQVQVDAAYWNFTQEPEGELGRLETAWVTIPYPWVKDELHEITFVTNTGMTFGHTIEVAEPTPKWTVSRLAAYALLGIYVGVIPVTLGLFFYPFLKTLGTKGLQFILSLTIGLLAFLLVDTILEGLELVEMAAGAFQGPALVWLAALTSFLILLAVGRYKGRAPEGAMLAFYLALGIGLHNLGEGLAIGAAFVSGEAALGTFLVVGFTLHNITEGIGIASPLVDKKPSLWTFIGLAALAGLPAILGTWTGAFAYSPQWAALLLGIGAGAILQVMVEVGAYLIRQSRQQQQVFLSTTSISGFSIGILVMYVTALLVNV
jgi:hypothetical protein